MRFSRAFAVAAAVALAFPLVACGSSDGGKDAETSLTSAQSKLNALLPDEIKKSGQIRVAGPVNVPPNIFLESDGKTPTGFMIDLANATADALGVKVSFAQMPFPSLIPGLQAGKIDMTLTVSDTPERQKTLSFVDFLDDGIVLLVAKGNPDSIGGLADLCGKTAALLSGSIAVGLADTQQAKCKADGKPAIKVKQFGGVSDALLQIQTGQASAFFGGRESAVYTAQTAEGGKVYEVVPGGPYTSQPYAMAVPKADTALRDALQAALQALTDDGTVKKIASKYNINEGLYSKIEINVAK